VAITFCVLGWRTDDKYGWRCLSSAVNAADKGSCMCAECGVRICYVVDDKSREGQKDMEREFIYR
jgi:hypothetical protein